jgi:hypothetical protein
MSGKVVIYNNCGCVIPTITLNAITKTFLEGMMSGGTYYNINEQTAIDQLVEEMLTKTGSLEVYFRPFKEDFPVGGNSATLYIETNLKHAYYWDGLGYVYLFSQEDFTTGLKAKLEALNINGEPFDAAGAITLTASDVGAEAAGSMAAHIAAADPHPQYILDSEKAQPNGIATLDVTGKVPSAQIPDIAVSDYLGAVANQVAMLALVGQKGDWCTRTDLGTTWIISGNTPSQLSSWTQLSYPAAPVTSVNGETGSVVLDATDVGAIANQTAIAQTANYWINGTSYYAAYIENNTSQYSPLQLRNNNSQGTTSILFNDNNGYGLLVFGFGGSAHPTPLLRSKTFLYSHQSDILFLSHDGSNYVQHMAIKANSNIIIGPASATDSGAKLQVNQTGTGIVADFQGFQIYMRGVGATVASTQFTSTFDHDANAAKWRIWKAASETTIGLNSTEFYINNGGNGNVNISTNSPSNYIRFATGNENAVAIGGPANAGIDVYKDSTTGYIIYARQSTGVRFAIPANTGNILINTTSDNGAKLQVNGTASLVVAEYADNAAALAAGLTIGKIYRTGDLLKIVH